MGLLVLRPQPASSGGPPAFDPLSVGTPLVWYDAAQSTQTGAALSTLPDQSGNGNDASVPIGAFAPGYTSANAAFNGLPTIDFPDGDQTHVNTPDLGLTTGPVTFVLVCNTNSSISASSYLVSASNAKAEILAANGGVNVAGSNDDGADNVIGGNLASGAAGVIVYVADGAASKMYVNSTIPVTGYAGPQDLTGRTIKLGTYGAASGTFWSQAGSTAHFMAFDGALSHDDAKYLSQGFGALAGVTIQTSPAVLSLTSWVRDFAAAPWSGTASAGPSGARSYDTAGSDPTTGTAVNGHTPALFDGVANYLQSTSTIADLFHTIAGGSDSDGGTVLVLFKAASAVAGGAGTPYALPGLFSSIGGGDVIVSFAADGVHFTLYNGGYNEQIIACGTGAWHLAQMSWNGSTSFGRVDGGSPVALGVGGTSDDNTLPIGIGTNYAHAALFDGSILEVMTLAAGLSTDDLDAIREYLNARYGLSV